MKPMLSNQRGPAGYWLTELNVTSINAKIYYPLSSFNFLMVQGSQSSSFGRRVVALLREYDLIAQGLHQQQMAPPVG